MNEFISGDCGMFKKVFLFLFSHSKETPENKRTTCYDIEVEVVSQNCAVFHFVCLFVTQTDILTSPTIFPS